MFQVILLLSLGMWRSWVNEEVKISLYTKLILVSKIATEQFANVGKVSPGKCLAVLE